MPKFYKKRRGKNADLDRECSMNSFLLIFYRQETWKQNATVMCGPTGPLVDLCERDGRDGREKRRVDDQKIREGGE